MSEYQSIEDQISEEAIIHTAIFGKQVEEFFNSDIGRYLLIKADSEKKGAIVDLKECDPTDWKEVQKHQNRIKMAEDIAFWLQDAVQRGLAALQIIDESREGTDHG